ncbi:YaiO family outer membrane beta-barrel protein [Brevundimonas sp.]|uniref:YaiO family outer membrane beta-barrel protein n=1 Tax=Brevundimonas sp. TaxID=1871086 RepID=UPI002737AE09|nr:YaiO family outer membrane beta-barrel protein [Brevundimonas sp.]MDP3803578.1 YaiO family outer membrane beta-barrel protein [Brevundimonas sp.]
MIVAPPEPASVVQVDPQSLYQAAVADRVGGRPAEAVAKLERVLAVRPDHVDARLNLGLALLALGRLDEAETAFLAVARQTPAYVDAWVGLARVEQRRGDLPAARRVAGEAVRLAPGDAEARALLASLASPPSWRVDITGARSRLSAGLPDWTEARVSASRRLGEGWSAGGAVEVTERFDDTDVYLEARLDRAFDGGDLHVAVGGAPDADYRPEIALVAGGSVRLTRRFSATLDASVARYPTGTVTGLHPGVRVDLPGDRVQLSARWINVRDENGDHRSGYAAQARWQATNRIAFRAGYADAPESSEGATVDVEAWNLGTDLDVTERLTLRIGFLSEDRGAYDREELSLGLGWRF